MSDLVKILNELNKNTIVENETSKVNKMYENGDKYEGGLRDNKKEGKGILYYKNGNRFEGEIRNDKQDGDGIYYFSNGDKYIGKWSNGKVEYNGILFYDKRNKCNFITNNIQQNKGIYYYDTDDNDKDGNIEASGNKGRKK